MHRTVPKMNATSCARAAAAFSRPPPTRNLPFVDPPLPRRPAASVPRPSHTEGEQRLVATPRRDPRRNAASQLPAAPLSPRGTGPPRTVQRRAARLYATPRKAVTLCSPVTSTCHNLTDPAVRPSLCPVPSLLQYSTLKSMEPYSYSYRCCTGTVQVQHSARDLP